MTVVASAVGPLLLATYVELTGSCAVMFYALGAVVGLAALAEVAVPMSHRGA